MPLRAAIWAAVSSPTQAEKDKASIPDQLKKGHEIIKAHGWFFAGEYVVPGQSRTSLISLSHAEDEIPALKALLTDASEGKFDIVYVYDLNRFRSLMMQVFETLCDYDVQIYNYDDPNPPPVPREEYNHERKNAARLHIQLHAIISGQESNTFTKIHRDRMPARITEKGLHAGIGGPPYGYRKVHPLDRHTPYIQEPSEIRILNQMKDWLFEGASINQIAARLNSQKIPTKKRVGSWQVKTIRYMLANPYYAGVVFYSVQKYTRDRRSKKKLITKNPSPYYNQGRHVPVWDRATHQKILDIIIEHGKGHAGNHTQRFTSLLRCWCGATLHRSVGHHSTYYIWRCSSRELQHTRITDRKAMQIVIPKIIDAIKKAKTVKISKVEKDLAKGYQSEIEALKKKQKRWMDLFESGSIEEDAIKDRLKEIKQRIDAARGLLAKQEALDLSRQNVRETILQLQQLLDKLPVYYKEADPIQVNAHLRTFIEAITVTQDHRLKITWKK